MLPHFCKIENAKELRLSAYFQRFEVKKPAKNYIFFPIQLRLLKK